MVSWVDSLLILMLSLVVMKCIVIGMRYGVFGWFCSGIGVRNGVFVLMRMWFSGVILSVLCRFCVFLNVMFFVKERW